MLEALLLATELAAQPTEIYTTAAWAPWSKAAAKS